MNPIVNNGEYLVDPSLMDFPYKVQIDFTRFFRSDIICSKEDYPLYPYLPIIFSSDVKFKVLFCSNEPESSPNREPNLTIISNHKKYDLILTSSPEILETCSNSRFFPYGTTWLNKNKEHKDSIGLFDESSVPPIENKNFNVTFLYSDHSHIRKTVGYSLRGDIWNKRNDIKIPKLIYHSNRTLIATERKDVVFNGRGLYKFDGKTIDGESFLPNDDKINLFNTSQYSIAIENTSEVNYFTEKLIDCLITKTIPIYWGCPNIGDFFDTRGFVLISDIDDFLNKINSLNEKSFNEKLEYVNSNFEIAKKYAEPLEKRIMDEIDEYVEHNKIEVTVKETKELTDPILTIGILTMPERKQALNRLIMHISKNTPTEYTKHVQLIINNDNGTKSVGKKRNEILEKASGSFVCFIDDDDMVDPNYINKIIDTIKQNPNIDGIGMSGIYYNNGKPELIFKHATAYGGNFKKDNIQYRPLNHLNPVRIEHALAVKFPEKNFGEDADYSARLFAAGLIKNEVIIEEPVLYHYLFNSNLSRTHN